MKSKKLFNLKIFGGWVTISKNKRRDGYSFTVSNRKGKRAHYVFVSSYTAVYDGYF